MVKLKPLQRSALSQHSFMQHKAVAPAPAVVYADPLAMPSIAKEMKELRSAHAIVSRPRNLFYTLSNYSYWTRYAEMDYLKNEVSILSTVIQRSSTEIVKYGIDWEPKFKRKCTECEAEYQQSMTVCPACGSTKLVKPDEKQKNYFVRPNGKSFLKEANENGQTLKDVVKSYIEMEYSYNEAGITRVSSDTLDPYDMSIEKSRTMEFLAIDPKFRRLLYDGTGKPGELYGFTADNRHMVFTLTGADTGYTDDGKAIYPAHWAIGESYGATGNTQYYTKDEMYSDHWFSPSLTYGVPIWESIKDDLWTFHYIEKGDLKRLEAGFGRGILVLPGFEDGNVQDVADSINQTLATNPNAIAIVGIPRQLENTAKLDVQFVPLGTDNIDATQNLKRDIRERIQAHAGVPNLIAGDTTASGGMNNESQQLTMYDRYLVDKYDLTDNLLDWVISWFPQITHWYLRVSRPMRSDTEMREKNAAVDFAEKMKRVGFAPTEYLNNEFTFPQHPSDPGAGGGMGGFGGGMRGGPPLM